MRGCSVMSILRRIVAVGEVIRSVKCGTSSLFSPPALKSKFIWLTKRLSSLRGSGGIHRITVGLGFV